MEHAELIMGSLDETRKYFVRRNPKGVLAWLAW
jgi:hypothetical protein